LVVSPNHLLIANPIQCNPCRVSVTKLFLKKRKGSRRGIHLSDLAADSVEVKAIAAQSGDHSLSVMANFGANPNEI